MARMRVFMVFVLAITAGGALAFGTYNFMQQRPVQTASIPTRPVVVAAADLDVGAELRREDIRIIEWPANYVPANAISDPKDVIGRGIVLPVIQNEPILPNKLASKEEGSGLPPAIPPGLRAVGGGCRHWWRHGRALVHASRAMCQRLPFLGREGFPHVEKWLFDPAHCQRRANCPLAMARHLKRSGSSGRVVQRHATTESSGTEMWQRASYLAKLDRRPRVNRRHSSAEFPNECR